MDNWSRSRCARIRKRPHPIHPEIEFIFRARHGLNRRLVSNEKTPNMGLWTLAQNRGAVYSGLPAKARIRAGPMQEIA